MKMIGLLILLVGVAGSAVAAVVTVPEIDATSSIGALALLSGALLLIRSRQRKQ